LQVDVSYLILVLSRFFAAFRKKQTAGLGNYLPAYPDIVENVTSCLLDCQSEARVFRPAIQVGELSTIIEAGTFPKLIGFPLSIQALAKYIVFFFPS